MSTGLCLARATLQRDWRMPASPHSLPAARFAPSLMEVDSLDDSLQGGTTSTISNGSVLGNALAVLDEDGELPLGQATPLMLAAETETELELPVQDWSKLAPVGDCSLGGLGGQSKLVIDEVRICLGLY